METRGVKQCPGTARIECGKWYHEHESGLCKQCRHIKAECDKRRKPRKVREHKPEWGSAEWAETRGDDIPDSGDR